MNVLNFEIKTRSEASERVSKSLQAACCGSVFSGGGRVHRVHDRVPLLHVWQGGCRLPWL